MSFMWSLSHANSTACTKELEIWLIWPAVFMCHWCLISQYLRYEHDMTQGPVLSWVQLVLIFSIFFPSSWAGCLIKFKEANLFYHLPRAGELTAGFMPFPKALLVQSKKWTFSSKILAWVTNSISYNDSHYAIHTFNVCLEFKYSDIPLVLLPKKNL